MTKVKDIIDAIEKNGLPQTKGAYWKAKDGANLKYLKNKVVSACAIGMAAYNLGIYPNRLTFPHANDVIRWNDDKGLSFQEIAAKYRELYPEYLEREVIVEVIDAFLDPL
jgi:hypothetical protein